MHASSSLSSLRGLKPLLGVSDNNNNCEEEEDVVVVVDGVLSAPASARVVAVLLALMGSDEAQATAKRSKEMQGRTIDRCFIAAGGGLGCDKIYDWVCEC